MKQNQVIVRILMAVVIMFGVETTANAQFGKLLKKAKEAVTNGVEINVEKTVKKKVEEKVEETVEQQVPTTTTTDAGSYSGGVRNASGESSNKPFELPLVKPEEKKEEVLGKVEPGEPGKVTIKVRKSGKVLGTYDRAAMKLTASNGKVYQFKEDGTVTDGAGTKIGSIEGQIFNTPRGEQIRCDEIGIIFVGKKNVGASSDGKKAMLGDLTYIDASDKMNEVVLAYFVYATQYSNEQLLKIKIDYEKATTTNYMTDEEYMAEMKKEVERRHGSSSSSTKSGADMELRRNGSVVGSIKADGTVYVGGSNRGKIDANGNIYVGGQIKGLLRSNGEVLKDGHIVGTIDSESGNVRINGSIVGGISNMFGDVRLNGRIIGKVQPVADLKKAAVFYFFGFW